MPAGMFNTLKDENSELSEAVSVIIEGSDVNDIDGSGGNAKGGLAFSFKDSSGNAVLPSLNLEGALPVTLDAGTTKRANGVLLSGAQTKDTRIEVGTGLVADLKVYTKMSATVTCSRQSLFEFVHVNDVGVTAVETEIGSCIVDAGQYTFTMGLDIDIHDASGGTGIQHFKIFHTPLQLVSDARANWSVNEVA